MEHRSLHLKLPNVPPYAGEEALESFVGIHVIPIAKHLDLFWFSRYGGPGAWEVRFRFSVEKYALVKEHEKVLVQQFEHGEDGCGNYDYVKDLGWERFLGADSQNKNAAARALLIYEFLTSAARLFIDALIPSNGGWKHETETNTGFNRLTSLESVHHLFCNMTRVPTWAAVLHFPHKNGEHMVVSDLQSRQIIKNDPKIQVVDLPRIQH